MLGENSRFSPKEEQVKIKAPDTSGTLIWGKAHLACPCGFSFQFWQFSYKRKLSLSWQNQLLQLHQAQTWGFLKGSWEVRSQTQILFVPYKDRGLIRAQKTFIYLSLVTFCGKCKVLCIQWKFVNARKQEMKPTCLHRKRTVPNSVLRKDLSKVSFITAIPPFSSTHPFQRRTQQTLQNKNKAKKKTLKILPFSHNASKKTR